MSESLVFSLIDVECRVHEGVYWVSRHNMSAPFDWSARFRADGAARWERIDPPSADDDDDAGDWTSLEAAQLACARHHAQLVALASLAHGECVEAART